MVGWTSGWDGGDRESIQNFGEEAYLKCSLVKLRRWKENIEMDLWKMGYKNVRRKPN
jgi:hypothetical protein